ncbi:MAG: hypothetical protein C4562_07095 [Actinobacteria bacterium]|nr:MAG: hypothetical protein C4562_07095 [Actinomycetota bacterium]
MSDNRCQNNNLTGFSLAEVLIASTISLLLLAALLSVYMGGLKAYNRTEQRISSQRDSRYALRSLSNDLKTATDVLTPTLGNSGNVLELKGVNVRSKHMTQTSSSPESVWQADPGNVIPWTDARVVVYWTHDDPSVTDVIPEDKYTVNRQNGSITFNTSEYDGYDVTTDFTYDSVIRYSRQAGNNKILSRTILKSTDGGLTYTSEVKKYVVTSYLSNDTEYLFRQPYEDQATIDLLFKEDASSPVAEQELAATFDLESKQVVSIMPIVTGNTLRSVFAINNNDAWAVGDGTTTSDTAFRYVDGSWQDQGWPAWGWGNRRDWKSVWFADEQAGFVVGGVTGGTNMTWLRNMIYPNSWYVDSDGHAASTGVWSEDINNTYACTMGGDILRYDTTYNPYGSKHWFCSNEAIGASLNSISGRSSTVVTVGNWGRIFRRDSSGAFVLVPYENMPSGMDSVENLWQINCVSNQDSFYFWVVGTTLNGKGTIIRSIESDPNHWEDAANGEVPNNSLNSVNFFDNEHGFIVGNNGTILRYSSDDDLWEQIAYPGTDRPHLYGVSLHAPSSGWAVGQNGTILRIGTF